MLKKLLTMHDTQQTQDQPKCLDPSFIASGREDISAATGRQNADYKHLLLFP